MTWALTFDCHIWPEDDLLEHEMSPACPCGPTEERIEGANGARWLWTHHALDNREATEVQR